MHGTGIERRKHQRFQAELPVNIGLIDLKSGKPTQALFKGIGKDISVEGLGLELNCPAPDIFSFGTRLMGENKKFDLDLNANVGTKGVRGVGEVRWARIHLPDVLRMGVFLKQMKNDEKEKWTNFVMSRSKGVSKDVSCRQTHSEHTLIKSLGQAMEDLIESHLSRNYILPVLFVTSSVLIYWLVEIRYSHLIILCGITTFILLLNKSRIFPGKSQKPKYKIWRWFLRKLDRSLRKNIPE
jgi:hypothetical protein